MHNQSSRNGTTNNPADKSKAKTDNMDKPTTSVRVLLTIPKNLLKEVDEAAAQDYTTRSDIIRQALLWYLRPQGRELAMANPDRIVKLITKRKASAKLRKFLKDNVDEIDVYDG